MKTGWLSLEEGPDLGALAERLGRARKYRLGFGTGEGRLVDGWSRGRRREEGARDPIERQVH